MSNIKIITDSNSDLTEAIIKQNDLIVVPQYINFDDDSFKDRVDISVEKLYEKISVTGRLPKTASPSPANFFDAFKPCIDDGQDILCICTSSKLSSTYQNACIAAEEFPEGRIEIIDTMNISMGLGILVLEALDCVKNCSDIHQAADSLRDKITKIRTCFIVDTLEYLQKGGRCSSLQSFVGGILKIRPVLNVADGKLALVDKVRGKREKALGFLLENLIKSKDLIDQKRIIIIHSMAFDELSYMKDEIEKNLNADEIIIAETGCCVSSHCGPKTIGIIYLLK